MRYGHDVDRGRAWLVLCACVINCAVALGIAMTCGVYVAAMIEHYRSSRAAGYVTGSLSYGLLYGTGSVASFVIDSTTHRTTAILGALLSCSGLILSANVPQMQYQYPAFAITAIGCGFMFQSSLAVIVLYFRKYRAFASAAVLAGGGLGVLLYPIFCLVIIDAYSWQPSLYIVAGVCLNTCVGSMIIKPECQDSSKIKRKIVFKKSANVTDSKDAVNDTDLEKLYENNETDETPTTPAINNSEMDLRDTQIRETKSNVDSSALVTTECELARRSSLSRNRSYLMLLANILLFSGPCTVPFVLGPDMYNEANISHTKQSILFLTLGVCNSLGRVLSGIVVNLTGWRAIRVYCVCNYIWVGGLAMFAFDNFACFVVSNVIYGLFFGCFISLYAMVTVDIVGIENFNRAFGIVGLMLGITGVLVPPLIGLVYDWTMSYTWPMLVAAGIAMLSALVILPPAFILR